MTILQQAVGYPVSQMSSRQSQALALLNAELIQDEGHSNDMTLPELKQRMVHWLDSGKYLCHAILHRNIPVAYCLWQEELSHVYVRQLFTLRSYRGRGLATKLLEHLKTLHSENKPLRLEVLAGNKQAIRFYEKQGFKLYSHTYQR